MGHGQMEHTVEGICCLGFYFYLFLCVCVFLVSAVSSLWVRKSQTGKENKRRRRNWSIGQNEKEVIDQ